VVSRIGEAEGRWVDRSVGLMVGRSGRSYGRSVGRSVGLMVGRSVGRSYGRSVGLIGTVLWSVGTIWYGTYGRSVGLYGRRRIYGTVRVGQVFMVQVESYGQDLNRVVIRVPRHEFQKRYRYRIR